jgi:putative heme-binding domain-containing protein
MRRGPFLLLALLPLAAQTPKLKLDDPAVIARGEKTFAATCGVGYCHGKEGRAGRGPRLAGRKWEAPDVFRVTSEGSENRLMPPFQGVLAEEEIWAVVAYVLSLGTGAAGTSAALGGAASGLAPSQPADPNLGDPEAGRAIFFDSANPRRCALCHQHGGRGAEVGPDLSAIGARPAREILRDILEPDDRLSAELLTVVTKAGERISGVKRQETRELVRLYDTSTLPPVLRTLYKDQIASTTPEKGSPMPGDYGRTLSRRQLLDLVSFLRGTPVSPADLDPPVSR